MLLISITNKHYLWKVNKRYVLGIMEAKAATPKLNIFFMTSCRLGWIISRGKFFQMPDARCLQLGVVSIFW